VNEVNTPPVLGSIGDKSVNELTALAFNATATDADLPANTLTYTLGAGAPEGAAITAGGAFTWTPSEAQSVRPYDITIIVSDGKGGTDSETITITVNEGNVAPVLGSIGDKSVDELSTLSFLVNAIDVDLPGNRVSFSLGAGAPSGATIGEMPGEFTWTPSEAQGPGSYPVTIVVSDGAGGTDSETITITVNEVADDSVKPVSVISGVPLGWINKEVTFTLSADDNAGGSGLAEIWYRIDSGTPKTYIEPITISTLGTTAVSYWSVDLAGNTEVARAAYIKIDTVAPTATGASPAYYSKLTKVIITTADTGGSGVKQVQYRVNGASPKTVTGSSATVSFTKLGANELDYRATDNAGNFPSTWKRVAVAVKYTSLTHYAQPTCPYRAADLYGYLEHADAAGAMTSLSGKTVSIQQYTSGAWKTIAKVTASDRGRWSYTANPTKKTTYRAQFAGDSTCLGQTSGTRVVLPKLHYSSAPKFSTYAHSYGKSYTVWGYVKPKHASGSVQVKVKAYRKTKQSDGTYKYVYKKTYYSKISNPSGSSYSKYKGSVNLPSKGKWRLRAYHAADSTNASSYSSYRYVTVE